MSAAGSKLWNSEIRCCSHAAMSACRECAATERRGYNPVATMVYAPFFVWTWFWQALLMASATTRQWVVWTRILTAQSMVSEP